VGFRIAGNYLAAELDTVKSRTHLLDTVKLISYGKDTPMNTVTHTEQFDDAFPYVLVSSMAAALVSLAAVWISAATYFGPMVGA